MPALRLRGVVLPDDTEREFWITSDGRISTESVPGAETVFDGGYLLPGLVDAHCHLGIGPDGPVELDEAAEQARADLAVGTQLIRDCGSPLDTSPLQQRADLPRIIRAGRHLARTKRYIPHIGVELDDPAELPAAVAEQAARGDGWVKLVGDWIDRGVGDLAPLWPDDVLAEAIATAHAAGARVTAHVFGEDALPGLLRAGIDCIEHGTGLRTETVDLLASSGAALVPTLINIETFPGIADAASKYPAYAKHMRALHAGVGDAIGAAIEAGVPVYAGSDAGGGIAHGRLPDEIVALHEAGLTPHDALGAACWAARDWLGYPGVVHGAPADLLGYRGDPRLDLAGLRAPALVVLRGAVLPGA